MWDLLCFSPVYFKKPCPVWLNLEIRSLRSWKNKSTFTHSQKISKSETRWNQAGVCSFPSVPQTMSFPPRWRPSSHQKCLGSKMWKSSQGSQSNFFGFLNVPNTNTICLPFRSLQPSLTDILCFLQLLVPPYPLIFCPLELSFPKAMYFLCSHVPKRFPNSAEPEIFTCAMSLGKNRGLQNLTKPRDF